MHFPTVASNPDAQTPLSQNTHSHIQNLQITNPRCNIGVRLSFLSTVKTSLRISHLLENLKTANQKVMMYICNYCKHFSPLSIQEYLTYTYT